MSFQQGLSGLNVSAKSLDAIGNNIANSGTAGFKAANARFSDVFAASLSGSGASQVGIGATLSTVFQQFTQGNVTATNNPLDLAINGGGFFRLSDATGAASGSASYTRNGQFSLNKDGYIVNSAGLYLTGIQADPATGIVPSSGQPGALKLDTSLIAPNVTTTSNIQMNLDARKTPPSAGARAGTLTGSAAPGATLITAGSNDTLNLTIDGQSATVTIPAGNYTSATLLSAVQTAINNTPAFSSRGIAVTVTTDTSSRVVITSNSVGTQGRTGSGSSVALQATPGNGASNLLGGAPTAVAGVDTFSTTNPLTYTASTSQTVYDSLGNPHSMSLFMVKTSNPNTWQMYTTLDGGAAGTSGSATGSVVIGAPELVAASAGGLTLAMTIDGVSGTVTIPAGAYGTAAALATAVTSAINGTAAFSAAGVGATASVNASGALVFTSNSTGSSSAVNITGGTGAASLVGTDTLVAGTSISPTLLSFNSSGALQSTPTLTQSFLLSNGASSPLTYTLDLAGTTQYGSDFGVNALTQDGYTSGRLSGISVADDGTVQGQYSNGRSRDMGRLVLATFQNPNGLQNVGGNLWRETADSGQPITGTAGQGNLGVIQSAAVEDSNVDLTGELVAMIVQQRAYQANAQTIKTQDQVLQTLVNLR